MRRAHTLLVMPPPADAPSPQDLLRDAGLRVTAVRVAAVRALAASPVALDATELAAAISSAGGAEEGEPADRVTVYRTLNTLVDSGIAHRIDPGDRVFRYSLTDHAHCTDEHHQHEHPHMVCDQCGAVECIEDAEVVIRPRAGGETSPARTFRITKQSVTLHGTCDRCAARV